MYASLYLVSKGGGGEENGSVKYHNAISVTEIRRSFAKRTEAACLTLRTFVDPVLFPDLKNKNKKKNKKNKKKNKKNKNKNKKNKNKKRWEK